MALASSAGVKKTQAAIDRDAVPEVPAISSPTISMANQSVNDNGGGDVALGANPTVTGVTSGAVK